VAARRRHARARRRSGAPPTQETASRLRAGVRPGYHSGAPEALALEDSFFNQASNWKGERYRAVFETAAVDIKGVTVELRTAMMWESIGALPQGTVSHAMASAGWTGVH
jgi:Bacterial toxin 5